MAAVAKAWLGLLEKMSYSALVVVVAKQTLADSYGSVNNRRRGRVIRMTYEAQLRHGGDKKGLSRSPLLSPLSVAKRTVLPRLMHIPERGLGSLCQPIIGIEGPVFESICFCRLHSVEQEGQNVAMLDLVATDEQYPERDQQQ